MARNNLLWIRDACSWVQDVGDTENSGSFTIDLLWKARSGDSAGSVVANANSLGSELRPDLRALAGALPDQDIQGAIVKRVILNYGFYFAAVAASLPGERDTATKQGWYEGLMIAPWQHSHGIIDPVETVGHPGAAEDSVAVDWLWWQRMYTGLAGQRAFRIGTLPLTENVVFSRIDTRNSRRIDNVGQSLYWSFSGGPGDTINGGAASWSVLLQLPS